MTTDQAGMKVSGAGYLPYGGKHWADGVPPTDFGFTAQRNEASFGLVDYNARYYSPYLGRFISPDPIGVRITDPQSFNRYSYVRNNPINRTDASGHCDWCQQKWEEMQLWWIMNNPFGGSVYGPPVALPTLPPTPNPAERVGPLLVDPGAAERLRQISEAFEQGRQIAEYAKELDDIFRSNSDELEFADQSKLDSHRRAHGRGVGARNDQDYLQSAQETVQEGISFTYTDRMIGETRMGYYNPDTNKFTGVSTDGNLTTHYRPDDKAGYPQGLQDSTFEKSDIDQWRQDRIDKLLGGE